jgi:urocanate hydratase
MNSETRSHPIVRAARGGVLSCKGWDQEAALRMLMNSLDPEVAERPEEMIACGTDSKPVADWASYLAIAAALKTLENDQTLVVRSGGAAGLMRTTSGAARVLISGDTSAAGWMYVGTQGALPETYESFRAAAQRHFGGELGGRLVVSAGMAGLGGAQGLAAQMNGAAFLGIDADPARIKRRVKGGYCDVMVSSLDEALRILKNAVRQRAARSVGLLGNAADVMTELAERGVVPDLLTDRTAAHDPLFGYWPQGMSLIEAAEMRRSNPDEARRRSLDSIAAQVRAMIAMQKLGAIVLDFGSGIFERAREAGAAELNFSPERGAARDDGRAPMRWIALSGEAADIERIDSLVMEMFPGDENLGRFMGLAQKHVRTQGLPARVCEMRRADCAGLALSVNDLVGRGELQGPIVVGRDFVDCGAGGAAAGEPVLAAGARVASAPAQATLQAAGGAAWAMIPERAVLEGAQPRMARAIVADGARETSARIESAMSR